MHKFSSNGDDISYGHMFLIKKNNITTMIQFYDQQDSA